MRLVAFGSKGVALAMVILAAVGSHGLSAEPRAEENEHWAFQQRQPQPVPRVKDTDWVRNPIDAFILAKLEEKGWKPAPAVESRALLRRITLDLTGLPPTPAEIDAFLSDHAPDALERAIEDLLARPAYGERWARHWLDLVRFAETNGYERDALKPNAWRYRDYVIQAFNSDKPFDRFLIEQLAGDEIPESDAETLVATGFNRMGPWDDEPADPKQDRFDQLDDVVSVTSEVFLGLTLGCARCHNHKFEPLTQVDYYRMLAVFNPLQRPRNGRTERDLPIGTVAECDALAERDQKIARLRVEIREIQAPYRKEHLASGKSKLAPEVLEALKRPPLERDEAQRALADRHTEAFEQEIAALMPPDQGAKFASLSAEIRALREATPDLPRGYFLHEPPGTSPETHVLARGQATAPGKMVEPGVPAVLASAQPAFPAPGARTTQRRVTLARWLAQPDHPLTARVVVNRIWQFHFGEGLVRSPSDFGTMGEPPTHPELLDWLADRFVADGWSIKKLHRLILASNTYRMSKSGNGAYRVEDPDNRLYWRFPYRRLEAEAIRDSMLSVSGQLNGTMFGPSMYPEIPREAIEAHSDPDKIWKPFDEREASRRTIYAMVKRSLMVPMLEVLDVCDSARSSPKRNTTVIAPQALTLLNGEFVNRQSRHLAARLQQEAGPDPAQQVDRAYLLALGREPSDDERSALVQYIADEAQEMTNAERPKSAAKPQPDAVQSEALARACRILFNLNEFVYPD
jgi:hypothetical protein